MPSLAILLGGLGIIPFVFFAVGAVGPNADSAQRMLIALIDYAALILTFAGGVHWGMGLSPTASRPAMRLGAGVLPLVAAWMALVLAQLVSPWAALALLCIGYLATVLIEHRAAAQWLLPRDYMWLRWTVSVIGLVMMGLVIILRAVGQTIVL